jgi:signal peptidase I
MLMLEENQPIEPKNGSRFLIFIWETFKVIVISLAIILPIRYYLVQPFFVKGASMESSFEDGDYLLIDELSYRFREPRRGDVVVFRYPQDKSQYFIKRIIGLPGEKLEIKNNVVRVFSDQYEDGKILNESYLSTQQVTFGDMTVNLGNNEFFVMGDNRLQSSDSRRWGPVDDNLITGRVLLRAWPFPKFTLIPEPQY